MRIIKYISSIIIIFMVMIFLTDNSASIDANAVAQSNAILHDIEDNIKHSDDIRSDLSYTEITDKIYNIKMDDNITESLSSDVLKSMIYEFEGVYYIDSKKCMDYVVGLSNKYDTYGKTRLFRSSGNEYINLSPTENDTFKGYKLDVNSVYNSLINNIAVASDSVIQAVWLSKGITLSGMNDIGDSYFEISLDNQHIWLYINNELIADANVVTGLYGTEYETPKGIYYVRSLNENYNMNYGEGSAVCDYFILITPNGIGIHDSKKRNSFGGDIYKTKGSHGCINTPSDKAELFFKALSELKTSAIPVVIR